MFPAILPGGTPGTAIQFSPRERFGAFDAEIFWRRFRRYRFLESIYRKPINHLLTVIICSTVFLLPSYAVTMEGAASLGRQMERQEVWVPNSGIEQASISIAGITVSTIDPASLDFGTGSNLPIGGSALVFDQSELSIGNYGVSGSLTSSFDFFSIGLWLVGLVVVCIGLFSLSLEKRIGGIDSKELATR